MRISLFVLACLLAVCADSAAASKNREEPTLSPYPANAILRSSYWEGYSTALREQLADLAYGGASIVNHGMARTKKEVAWFNGYRDGGKAGAALAQRFYDRQLREPNNGN